MGKDKQLTFVWIFLIMMSTFIGIFVAYRYGLPKFNFSFTNSNSSKIPPKKYPENIKLTSSAFTYGEEIPEKYTCKGIDVNPPLSITNKNFAIKSFVLIVDDPDAIYKVWKHWIVYNIDPKTTQIYENFVPKNATSGQNDYGTDNYRGPCPPIGKHTYRYKLYGLNSRLDLKVGATSEDVEKAMEANILDMSELQGTFGK